MRARCRYPIAVSLLAALGVAACGDDEPARLTAEQLEAIMPTADDIGNGYAPKAPEAEDDDVVSDAAMEEACPEATELAAQLGTDEESTNVVEREFETEDGRQIQIALNPEAEALAGDDLTDLIAAVNECDAVEISGDDADTTMTFGMAEDDRWGDQGFEVTIGVHVEGDQLPQPLDLELHGVGYRLGTVGVTVFATDGVDETTFAAVPADVELASELAADLEPEIEALLE